MVESVGLLLISSLFPTRDAAEILLLTELYQLASNISEVWLETKKPEQFGL